MVIHDLMKMIGFPLEGQITLLKYCKALLFFLNDCDYILLLNSDLS